jgi:hypothetical protein
VLAYLGSTRNIIGCVFALLGMVIVFLGLAGMFWPAVLAGLYGVGVLIAPPERVRLTISHAEVETRLLGADLDALLRRVQDAQRFPVDVLAKVAELSEILRGILTRAETLTSSPSLEAYANLPRSYALTRRGERERSAHEELLAQLDLLATELGKIADAVHRGDEQALRDQGRFLRDRFGGSRLDL